MRDLTPPEPRLVAALDLLARLAPGALRGPALDLACGNGRHALLLARRGIETHAIDRDPEAVAAVARRALAEGLPLRAERLDLERPGGPLLAVARYTLIVAVNYLHRPLCPAIARALEPGGALFYETFTVDQPRFGRPTNPDFLLGPGELLEIFAGLEVLDYCEGLVEGPSSKATLLGRKPPA